MSKQQAKDEAITMFLAGQETTAVSLAWTLYLIARHPHNQARLGMEIDSVMGARRPDEKSAEQLVHMAMTLKESMRLYPPTWLLTRQCVADTRLGEYEVRKGSQLFISPYAVHRDPDVFCNPHEFDPERFSSGSESRINQFAYLPFGAGPRICIGRHLAALEQTLVIASILQSFEIALPPGTHDVVPKVIMTLHPDGGVPLLLRRRCS